MNVIDLSNNSKVIASALSLFQKLIDECINEENQKERILELI